MKLESDHLQGAWVGAEVGRESDGLCNLKFVGAVIEFQGADKEEHYKGEFLPYPDKEPMELAVIVRDGPQRDSERKWSLANYKLENGRLTLAFAGRAPGGEKAPGSFGPAETTRTFTFAKANYRD